MARAAVFLMYHELAVPGRDLCDSAPGYTRYVVSEDSFRAHLDALAENGIRGLSAGNVLEGTPSVPHVAITVDDGCETDLLVAAPLLERYGFGATFYVVSGFVGRRGFLSAPQLTELADGGFEIGSHSISHPFLPDLPLAEARRQIEESKQQLEQLLSRPVEHFSCPGGRWSPTVARLAEEAGYRSVATSRIGVNRTGTNAYRLARIAVLADTDAGTVVGFARMRGLRRQQARHALLGAAKAVLGNTAYQHVRDRILGPDAASRRDRAARSM